MGFIKSYGQRNFPGQRQGVIEWQRRFGNTTKEDMNKQPPVREGGSYGRSIVSSKASVMRLVEAMRSRAPGGWSDDRWEQTKHWTSITYLAGHRIGEQFMQSRVRVFHKTGPHPDDKREVHPDDPPMRGRIVNPYKLVELIQRPNRDDTTGDWLYSIWQQMTLTGSSLTWMLPNDLPQGKQYPIELYSIPTAIAIPQPAINPDYPDGYYRIQPVYPYGPFSSYPTPTTSVGAPIPAEWMMRIKYTHPLLRYDGWSPETAFSLHMDVVDQMDKSRFYGMKKLIQPSAILSCKDNEGMQPMPDEEIDRLLTQFENEIQGAEATGRLFIPPPGWTLEAWESNLRDLQFQEGWDQLVSFLMAGIGISKEAAGMVGTTAYAQLYATLQQLYWLTLKPICYRIGEKIASVLGPFFGDDLVVEVEPPRINDHELNIQRAGTLTAGKAITKNELRKLLEMEPTHAQWGEDLAGDPSPFEKEEMQKQQKMQEDQVGAEKAAQEQSGKHDRMRMEMDGAKQGLEWQDDKEAPEASQNRPSPGAISKGSKGPQMKSIEERAYRLFGGIKSHEVAAVTKVIHSRFNDGFEVRPYSAAALKALRSKHKALTNGNGTH